MDLAQIKINPQTSITFGTYDAVRLAHQIAHAASLLDELKNVSPIVEQRRPADRVEQLHDIAHMLAGDRVNEVYAPDDAAATGTTCANS